MASAIDTYLMTLGKKLEPASGERCRIKWTIDTILKQIDLYFGKGPEAKLLIGSYSRNTALPRRADRTSDIDIMIVFENPYLEDVETFVKKMGWFAQYFYSPVQTYQSNHSVVLNLDHGLFELIPAFRVNSGYYMPNELGEWDFADIVSYDRLIEECDNNNMDTIKPLVRLIKHWNTSENNHDIPSFELEKTIVERLQYAFLTCNTYTDYVKKAFGEVIYLNGGHTGARKALEMLNKAGICEEAGDIDGARRMTTAVFPDV